MQTILDWLGSSALGDFMRDVGWAFPTAEIFHFLGLCLLIGALLVVDLRVLGVGRSVPFEVFRPFTKFAKVGLLLNVVTGVAFVASDPNNYWDNPAFRWKMALVALGALNAFAFEFLQQRSESGAATGAVEGLAGKALAVASLTIWAVVIVLGRFLPYVGSGLG